MKRRTLIILAGVLVLAMTAMAPAGAAAAAKGYWLVYQANVAALTIRLPYCQVNPTSPHCSGGRIIDGATIGRVAVADAKCKGAGPSIAGSPGRGRKYHVFTCAFETLNGSAAGTLSLTASGPGLHDFRWKVVSLR